MKLKEIINETFNPQSAAQFLPLVKKYADRATQDKSPDANQLSMLAKELEATSKAPAQPAPVQQQAAQPAQAPVQASVASTPSRFTVTIKDFVEGDKLNKTTKRGF